MLQEQRDPKSAYPKFLPSWLELDYFRRPRTLRSARKWVTMGAFSAAALLAACTLAPRLRRLHEAAPVSTAHALFRDDCSQCHRTSFQPFHRFLTGDDSLRSVRDVPGSLVQ